MNPQEDEHYICRRCGYLTAYWYARACNFVCEERSLDSRNDCRGTYVADPGPGGRMAIAEKGALWLAGARGTA